MNSIDFQATTQKLLEVLDQRSRDIIVRRFGLTNNEPETLESIGKEYGITRERVRQIEAHAMKALSRLEGTYAPIRELLNRVFGAHGGILAESHLVTLIQKQVTSAPQSSTIHFYLQLFPEYTYVAHHSLFAPHWRHEKLVHEHAQAIITTATEILKKSRHPKSQQELVEHTRLQLGVIGQNLPEEYIIAAFVVSKDLGQTTFGEWGLQEWAEVSPRGVGDKAYAVLRRHAKPEHFRRITDLINEARFDTKRANAQTVHNELIKDERFVLVGRGLYGLKEWGYTPGTVADVLESVLREATAPLSRDELIEKVLQQRLVKKNTILLGLQNNKRFVKVAKNKYTLKGQS